MLLTGNFEDTNYVCGSGLPGIMFVEKKVIKKCFFLKKVMNIIRLFLFTILKPVNRFLNMLMKKLNFIVCLQVFSLGARWDPDPGEQNLENRSG